MTDVPFETFLEEKSLNEGKPIVIMGNSPSAIQEDINLLDSFTTIGVNRILQSYVPDYLLVCDDKIVKQEYDRITQYAGKKLLYYPLVERNKNQYLNNLEGKFGWSLVKGHGRDRCLSVCESIGEEWEIQTEGSTPAYAIQMAYLWGCNPIVLIGVDFNAPILDSPEDGYYDFDGDVTFYWHSGGDNGLLIDKYNFVIDIMDYSGEWENLATAYPTQTSVAMYDICGQQSCGYRWRVRAHNAAGWSEYSDYWEFTVVTEF